jgi:hypothetical protein
MAMPINDPVVTTIRVALDPATPYAGVLVLSTVRGPERFLVKREDLELLQALISDALAAAPLPEPH